MKYFLIILLVGCNITNEGNITIGNEVQSDKKSQTSDNTESTSQNNNSDNTTTDTSTVNSSDSTSSNSTNDTVGPSQSGCPEGYVFVEGRTFDVNGTNVVIGDFCIMKYEARKGSLSNEDLNSDGNSSNDYLVSIDHTQRPWKNVKAIEAQHACRGLGYDEITMKGYDVISNLEWMTAAIEIENTPENWSDGAVGSGYLFRGHTDNSPSRDLEVTNPADHYDQTGQTTGSQKILSSVT